MDTPDPIQFGSGIFCGLQLVFYRFRLSFQNDIVKISTRSYNFYIFNLEVILWNHI